MTLYLVRHGQALPKYEDPQRPLSDQGQADIRKVATFLGERGTVQVSRILHSGKLRARQTAEALAERLKATGSVSETDGLAPLDDPTVWAGRLAKLDEDLILVGHLPHMGKLAALLLTDNAEQPVIRFQMGGVVCLERDEEDRWSLRWMVVPQLLQ